MSVKCGHCKSRHVYVSDVRECADREAEAAWEYQMELAAERYWEEGPHGPQDDPRERELWAMEDERRDLAYKAAVGFPDNS